MPRIKAFQGWRYDRRRVGKPADVLAPPYDVISPEEQRVFHQKNPYNVIRLILGQKRSGDSARHNAYTRARDFLKDWIFQGVLVQESKPAIYVYVQNYAQEGRLRTRIGFMAAMRIEPGAVLKHENTLARPKKDRLALLKEVKTNLSPIFGLFEDKKAVIQGILKRSAKSSPVIDVTLAGVRHRLYVEERKENIERIQEILANKPTYIADGHHRFEVASQFKDYMNSKFPGHPEAPWNYAMVYFSDCINNPFAIFPTHRLVRIPGSVRNPLEVLARSGTLKKVKDLTDVLSALSKTREALKAKDYSFGIYTKKDGFYILRLNEKPIARTKKSPVDLLDVAVLHRRLIEPCFKIRAVEKSSAIDFTRDPEEARAKVDAGSFDLALFLRPTSLNEMLLVSKKGLKMPQKSTYFYPKLLSGLVFHRLDDVGFEGAQ